MSSFIIPTGWSRRPAGIDPAVTDCVCRQAGVGLYDGEKDLRHMGEGELFLTPTVIAISLLSVRPDPMQPPALQKQQQSETKLYLEMPLSSVASYRHISGFPMLSSPKVQLVLNNSNSTSPLPRISFRVGGIEFFEKQLEQALKKKAWLAATVTVPSTTTAATNSAAAAATATTSSHSSSYDASKSRDDAAGGFSTNRAGIAGVVAMQAQRSDALKQSIRSATTEVDELIVKGRELSQLMGRFREEVAKGNFKLIDDQVEQLKRLDSRFAQQQQHQHHGEVTSHHHSTSNSGRDLHSSAHYQPKRHATNTELVDELQSFLRSDSVLRHTVRVPLVELLAAFNVYRGFSFELAPQQFHACLCELVRNFPARTFSILDDDPAGCASVPSFELAGDHLVQCHVLAGLVGALEKLLGPRPVRGESAASLSAFRTQVTAGTASKGAFEGVALDEAQILLLLLEGDGVLTRDCPSSGTICYSWNVFAFV